MTVAARSGLMWISGAALLGSAFLLFVVQPMFTKMVLPRFGGAAGVWNAAVVFFQAVLLGGYVYAHLLARIASLRTQFLIHAAVLATALSQLPIAIGDGRVPAPDNPLLDIYALMLAGLGFPFFALAATAPLLQVWFSKSASRRAADPYFLYAASNAGSLVALVTYPTLIEPNLRLGTQSRAWSFGAVVLCGLLVAAAVRLWPRDRVATPSPLPVQTTSPLAPMIPAAPPLAGSPGPAGSPAASPTDVSLPIALPATALPPTALPAASSPGWADRFRWMLCAAAPASLLLAVTHHVTTDIASVPLFWTIPLALYLATYVIAFAQTRPAPGLRLLDLQLVAIVPVMVLFTSGILWIDLPIHLLVLFITCLVCHQRLAASRPHTAHLTAFYLWSSLGGVLGGLFAAIVAPAAFDRVLEYPLALGLACLLRPGDLPDSTRRIAADLLFPIVLAAIYLIGTSGVADDDEPVERAKLAVALVIIVLALAYRHRRPVAFGLGVGAIALLAQANAESGDVIARHRSFYAVNRVERFESGADAFNALTNGVTVHGAMRLDQAERPEPLTYYGREGPLGQLLTDPTVIAQSSRIGVIGLGTGSIACYRQPAQSMTFFEIDNDVVEIAREPRYFRFLTSCAPEAEILVGDGRLLLERLDERQFDLLIIDAFSSDAIPVHLLTSEAIALYFERIADDGMLVLHISNRYVDLEPVIAAIVDKLGLASGIQQHSPQQDSTTSAPFFYASTWVVLTRHPESIDRLDARGRWRDLERERGVEAWTDDYSDVFGSLRW